MVVTTLKEKLMLYHKRASVGSGIADFRSIISNVEQDEDLFRENLWGVPKVKKEVIADLDVRTYVRVASMNYFQY